jgi:DNA-binding MarR family transcriptional regulator
MTVLLSGGWLLLQVLSCTSTVVASTFPNEDVTMDTPWLDRRQLRAWIRLAAVLELLPGVLDAQLRRDAELTHFEYYVLAMLSEAPGRTLRMTELARQTNATLPRLSHVVTRLEGRGLVERFPCPEDRRATNARLTEAGWAHVREAAPGHVATVRQHVVDPLTDEQIDQLADIADALLARLDPSGAMAATYTRYDG